MKATVVFGKWPLSIVIGVLTFEIAAALAAADNIVLAAVLVIVVVLGGYYSLRWTTRVARRSNPAIKAAGPNRSGRNPLQARP